MMQRMEFTISHNDCPACISTEKFPEVKLYILQSTTHGNGKAEALQHSFFSGSAEGESFLGFWKGDGRVTDYGSIHRTPESALFHVSLHSGSGWVTDAIIESGGYFLESVLVQDGVERWRVLVEDRNKAELFSRLEALGAPRLEKVGNIDYGHFLAPLSPINSPNLTEKQWKVLNHSFRRGYFKDPREADSRELASELGISQSTFLEHLRKAQLKLYRSILEGGDEHSARGR